METCTVTKIGPGKEFEIGNIPAALTIDHNEVYYYWQHSGLKNAALVHVDAHSDILGGPMPLEDWLKLGNEEDYYKCLTIADFICSAVHYDLLEDVFWINPHSKERRIQYMGSKNSSQFDLRTNIYPSKFGRKIEWRSIHVKEKIISNLDMVGEGIILDIDLDAFCCNKEIENVRCSREHGMIGYEKRINESINLLKELRTRPRLITITQSVGQVVNGVCRRDLVGSMLNETQGYVPLEFLPDVQSKLLTGLQELYG